MDIQFIQNTVNHLRNERNKLLQESDKYLLADFPISGENLIKIKEYRQKLRDYFDTDEIKNFQNLTMPPFPNFPV